MNYKHTNMSNKIFQQGMHKLTNTLKFSITLLDNEHKVPKHVEQYEAK